MYKLIGLAVIIGLTLSVNSQAEKRCNTEGNNVAHCFFIKAGLGGASLKPTGIAQGWTAENEGLSPSVKLAIGHFFSDKWFAELMYADLGVVNVSNVNPNITGQEDISYQASAISVGYWLKDRSSSSNLYVKLGAASVNAEVSDKQVPIVKNNSEISVGVGMQWQVKGNWYAAVELETYSRDTKYAGASIVKYW